MARNHWSSASGLAHEVPIQDRADPAGRADPNGRADPAGRADPTSQADPAEGHDAVCSAPSAASPSAASASSDGGARLARHAESARRLVAGAAKQANAFAAGDSPGARAHALGIRSLSVHELLALTLRTRTGEAVADTLAGEILAHTRDLAGLARADSRDLAHAINGLTPARALHLAAALELGRRCAWQQSRTGEAITTPEAAATQFMRVIGTAEQEEVHVMCLDVRGRVVSLRMAYRGTLTDSPLRICEVFREAIRAAASSIILAHSHPSGDPTPSGEDVRATRNVIEAGKLLGIDVVDHIVVAGSGWTSLKQSGLAF